MAFWVGVSTRRPGGGPLLRAIVEEGSMVHALRDCYSLFVFLDS